MVRGIMWFGLNYPRKKFVMDCRCTFYVCEGCADVMKTQIMKKNKAPKPTFKPKMSCFVSLLSAEHYTSFD